MVQPIDLLYVPAALALVLSIVVWTQASTRQGRRLGPLLLAESTTTFLTAMSGLSEPSIAHASRATFPVVVPFSGMLYLWFLGSVHTPRARFVRGAWLTPWAILNGILLVMALVDPEWFFPDMAGRVVIQVTGAALFLVGLLFAVDQYLMAPPGNRSNEAWFLTAFGTRDAGWVIVLPTFALTASGSIPDNMAIGLLALTLSLFYVFIAYAILRANLFDIDLKIKFGLSRTTVAAIIAGAALVGSELIERLLGVDQLWPAVLIGATMSLATKPLIKIGDKLADTAMPKVKDTPDYRSRRSQEVYQAAWEQAMLDGIVTDTERDKLASLADTLGLSAGQARAIERGA